MHRRYVPVSVAAVWMVAGCGLGEQLARWPGKPWASLFIAILALLVLVWFVRDTRKS